MDEVLLINPSANVFVFGDFNVHQKDWLNILVELTDLVNPVIIILSQMTLPRWLTFPLGFLAVTLAVLFFWICFFFSDASICSTMVFSPSGNFDHVVVSDSIDFLSNSKQDAPFIA